MHQQVSFAPGASSASTAPSSSRPHSRSRTRPRSELPARMLGSSLPHASSGSARPDISFAYTLHAHSLQHVAFFPSSSEHHPVRVRTASAAAPPSNPAPPLPPLPALGADPTLVRLEPLRPLRTSDTSQPPRTLRNKASSKSLHDRVREIGNHTFRSAENTFDMVRFVTGTEKVTPVHRGRGREEGLAYTSTSAFTSEPKSDCFFHLEPDAFRHKDLVSCIRTRMTIQVDGMS
jgi:hypothetical protein